MATKGPVLLAANEMTAALSKERGGAYNETIKRLSVISGRTFRGREFGEHDCGKSLIDLTHRHTSVTPRSSTCRV